MTPERWQRIGDLFDAVLRVDPAGRDAWLRSACDGDDGLRVEITRLLDEDARAERDGFLPPPESTAPPPDQTGSWAPRTEAPPPPPPPADESGGFTPRQAIAMRGLRETVSEPPEVVRARLRELPMVYVLILAATTLWRHAVLEREELALSRLDLAIVAVLVGLMALLWSRCRVTLAGLKALELGMISLLAGRIAYAEYRLVLAFSLDGDRMMAQLTFKNIVLLTAALILTYGLYVPKSWRRAALVVGPLALLPFATLAVLSVRHPEPMAWLGKGWNYGTTPRAVLFTFDGLILVILAACATYGARTISRLRRQVAEARELGQYRLVRRVGAGGMGEVYLAEHLLLKRPCAVKLIREVDASDPRALERFEREVRLTATLSHPNTVEVYDYGRAEDGTYYYVMEFLKGLSLAELVERYGPLPPGRVVYLIRQVCGALREAHAACLIHRDLKPSNIFAARRGGLGDVAKLLDFGLVLPRTKHRAAHLSGEGQILGTPLFMSPEQATGSHQLDARSDIYSLGAVAYYVLTGRPPFDGASSVTVLIAHARDPVVAPSRVRPDIPDDLEQVVLRCLAKDPDHRFPDVESLERALGACCCAGDWDQGRASRWWRDSDATGRLPDESRPVEAAPCA
jgi:serine/threonine-protein kinase